MDVFLDLADEHLLDKAYAAAGLWKNTSDPAIAAEWGRDDLKRQALSIFVLLNVGAALLYFSVGGLSWYFLFDKKIREHKRFIPNQEWVEIGYACQAIPWIAAYSTPLFVAEVRGHSALYDNIADRGWRYAAASVFMFFMWNDFAVYWVHRALHHPLLYARVHKVHHLFKVVTPFAALAFTPMDGFLQSLPYHLFVFMVPMHKMTYLVSFVLIQLWTLSIHDNFFMVPEWLDEYLNGAAHHTIHHAQFNYNHGLYTTLWDRIGGTHRTPQYAKAAEVVEDPNDSVVKKVE